MKTNPLTAYMSWIRDISYPEYTFRVKEDGRGDWYLQAEYEEADIFTDKLALQLTRRWYFSPEMTKSEFAQTALKCILTSMEHRVREHFTYRGERVYSPHHNVDDLWTLTREHERDTRA
jgi:hypothetical protein